MRKKIFLCSLLVLLMAAAADPLMCFAEGDPLASPTPQPTQRITAPVISGVNPEIITPEGDQGDSTPSGGLALQTPLGLGLALPPTFVDLEPQAREKSTFNKVENVSCGPAALALALDLMDKSDNPQTPSALLLERYLKERGLLYKWGTGVEELVFAARNFGYPAAQTFHRWNLEEVVRTLKSGQPLVVPLGINGSQQPGHFVVLTGISSDGNWFYCKDPHKGDFRISREEFQYLWELQGRAGVAIDGTPFSTSADLMLPWMGMLSALAAVTFFLNRSGDHELAGWYRRARRKFADPHRKGIGGGLLGEGVFSTAGDGISSGVNELARPEQPHWVQVGLRGIKKKVPVYKTKRVQVGLKKEIRQVPIYKKVKVYCGTRLVDKKVPVTRYRIKKVWAWKKVIQRVPQTRMIGSKRVTIGYQNQTRWKRVQAAKRIPYQTTKTIRMQEPIFQIKKVQAGTRTVTRWVPKYQEKQILAGYKTVEQTIPVFEKTKPGAKHRNQTYPTPGGLSPGGEKGDPPISAKDLRLKDLLLKVPLPEQEINSLLRKGVGPTWPPVEKNLSESWLYKTILFFQGCKEAIGRVVGRLSPTASPSVTPHLFSYTAYQDAPLNLLTEDGIQINSFVPPRYLDLLYTRRELEIKPKVAITAYPDGLMNLNLTRKSLSMKIGQRTIFLALTGEFGFVAPIDVKNSYYDYQQAKHSFSVDSSGIQYKVKYEGITVDKIRSSELVEVKEINSISCKLTTIRALGVLVGVLAVGIIAALLYLYFSAGAPFPLPIEVPL